MSNKMNEFCLLCDPYIRCSGATKCEDCDVTFCSACYKSHKTSCKAICDGKFHLCREHDMEILRYCVECFHLTCILCPCEGHHKTFSIRDSFDNFSRECKASIEELDLRIKLEESYSERLIEMGKKHSRIENEVKNVGKEIYDRLIEIEGFINAQLIKELSECGRYISEIENAKSTLTLARFNATTVENVQDPILFLGKWENPIRACDCYDTFSKERKQKITETFSILEESITIRDRFYNTLFKGWNRIMKGNVENMTVNDDSTSDQIASRTTDACIDRTEVFGYLLEVSECLPDIVNRIKEEKEFGQFGYLQKNENIEVDAIVQNIRVAYDFIIKQHGDIIVKNEQLMDKTHSMVSWVDKETTEREAERKKFQKEIKYYQDELDEKKNNNKSLLGRLLSPEKGAGKNSGSRFFSSEEMIATEISKLKSSLSEKENLIDKIRNEKDDLQSRLSSLAGEQLTKGNPAITDLRDQNRPMKIGEKYGELYDNEWTDSMVFVEEIKSEFNDIKDTEDCEEVVVHHLCKLLMDCYRDCKLESQLQYEALGLTISTIGSTSAAEEEKSDSKERIFGEKEFHSRRRVNAKSFAECLLKQKRLCRDIFDNWDYPWKSSNLFDKLMNTPYFQKCVLLCWYMVIQDPMMYLEDELKKDSTFDKTLYKEFVQKGDRVKFVVWPALYLYKGGPLLYKGVVQAYLTQSES